MNQQQVAEAIASFESTNKDLMSKFKRRKQQKLQKVGDIHFHRIRVNLNVFVSDLDIIRTHFFQIR